MIWMFFNTFKFFADILANRIKMGLKRKFKIESLTAFQMSPFRKIFCYLFEKVILKPLISC